MNPEQAAKSSAGSIRQIAALIALTAMLLLVIAAPAPAAESRVQIDEFGQDGTANSNFDFGPANVEFGSLEKLAFDQVTKRLYAMAANQVLPKSKIWGFDVSSPGVYSPLGGNFPITTDDDYLGGLGVDNSGLSSAGNIYSFAFFTKPPNAFEPYRYRLRGFDSSGTPLGGNFPLEDPTVLSYRDGAVDPSGNLWAVTASELEAVKKYSPAGAPESSPIGLTEADDPFSITFAPNGDAYVGMVQGGRIFRFTFASGYTAKSEFSSGGGRPVAMAVDPSTNYLYVVRSQQHSGVDVFDSSGTLLYSFDTGLPQSVLKGIAIDPTTDRVFLADFEYEKIRVFGPYGPVVEFTLDAASGLTGTHATLSGTVNPSGTTITECKFEYGLSASYGQSVPCEGSIPADSSPHAVSASLTNLAPQGRTYHFRISLKKNGETVRSKDKTFVTPDTVFTEASTSITDDGATVTGKVRPDGVALSECKFEYGPNTAYGSSVPCTPAAGSIPADTNEHAVSAAISGLAANSAYHYRLVAVSGANTLISTDKSFSTPGPPLILEASATDVGEEAATLGAQVNPGGSATTFHFEYGLDSSYGSRLPASDLSAGSGTSPVVGSVEATGLEPGTTYHYRVVATNSFGTSEGPDQTFLTVSDAACPNAAIRAEQTSPTLPGGSTFLPRCMALEMVSPPTKFNQDVYAPGLSLSGDRITFTSDAALADTPKLGGILERYVASRTASGWQTEPAVTPVKYVRGSDVDAKPCSLSGDLSRWSGWGSTAEEGLLGITTAYEGGVGGHFSLISPTLVPTSSNFKAFGVSEGSCQGSSLDASHEFIAMGGPVAYLPGDPEAVGAGGNSNVYAAYRDANGTPTAELLTRDRDGVVHGGACGATVGGRFDTNGPALRGAISPDASSVYFSTRPNQAPGVECNTVANKLRVMKRTMTPAGPEISEISTSECDRVSPPCSSADGNDYFQGASQEGDKVFIQTTRQLTDSDLDTSADLYLYDASRSEGSRLTQASAGDASNPTPGKGAGVLGVADLAGDGSRVYFVATGQLTTALSPTGTQAVLGQPNLYMFERDAAHPGGRTAFIATLAAGDVSVWSSGPSFTNTAAAVPLLGDDLEDVSVGGDGHIFAFLSKVALVPADTDGGAVDAYRYDSSTGALELVSGGNGPFDVEFGRSVSVKSTPNILSFDRSVSNDGATIVFRTEEALDPADADAKPSIYIWHEGALTAIPLPAREASVSLSGEEVSFATDSRLVPQDGDGVRDIYVARVDGGFPNPVAPVPCAGEACQGPPGAPPAVGGTASSSFAGAGNVAAQPKKQGKKKKKKSKKKNRGGKAKKASHKRGGQK